jgi:ubiquinone/menaquinone biosynthesis C-methylase UbiE
MTVLDAGCGTGNYSIKLTYKGCKVTAIDLSSAMLDVARQKNTQLHLDIDYQEMDMTCLKFADNSFDAVFSMTAWEFIEDSRQSFKELMRVLKPGGCLLIGLINSDSAWGDMYNEKIKKQPQTVFQFTHKKDLKDLVSLSPENLVGTAECLYIPPAAPDEAFTPEGEALYKARGERPGFIVAMWQK